MAHRSRRRRGARTALGGAVAATVLADRGSGRRHPEEREGQDG